jgi:hypothetical protein
MRGSIPGAVTALLAAALFSSVGWALDKQGSAHGGSVAEAPEEHFDVSGAASFGASLYNPTYAARPDNTGLALFRYAGHADIDLLGRKLSIPLDLNMFTDRERSGLAIFLPTELDVIGGVTSTWPLGPGALELGARVEHDRPVDQGSFTQTYVDARARWVYSLADAWTDLARARMDISGWFTLGVFVINPTYAARPDNSGKALLRYAVHGEYSILNDLLSFGLDGIMFTDRETSAIRPSELDLTPEIIVHFAPWELHLAYERDMPIDRSGSTQSYVYALAAWSFDLKQPAEAPLETRAPVISP